MSIAIALSCVLIVLISQSIADKSYRFTPLRSLKDARCLTGYMTDVQRWVDEYGQLTPWSRMNSSSIEISTTNQPETLLELEVKKFRSDDGTPIQYLSMSHCGMTRVLPVFHFRDRSGRSLADTLEYVTLYGNDFGNAEADEELYDVFLNATEVTEITPDIASLRTRSTLWSVGFHGFTFSRLKELDLRACAIETLGNNSFQRMPQLRNLYLGENHIHYIESTALTPLKSLKYLDLSRNIVYDHNGRRFIMTLESSDVLRGVELEYLDLSYTILADRNIALVKNTESTLKTLSLCYTSLGNSRSEFLYFPSMKYLDVSGNPNILDSPSMIQGLRDNLKVLYAQTTLFRDMEFFRNFTELEILKLTDNEVSSISSQVAQTLTSLQILDLDHNRMSSWSNPLFSRMPNLKMLSLANNNINIVRGEMYNDFRNLSFIGLADNALVCNCQAREMFEVALKNEMRGTVELITAHNKTEGDDLLHMGYKHYNQLIQNRRNITTFCQASRRCNFDFDPNIVGNYVFLDYYEDCSKAFEGSTVKVFRINTCSQPRNDMDKNDHHVHSREIILFLLIPCFAIMFLGFLYVFRKNLRYFFVTMRNSAMLSLINNKDGPDEGLIYNYDVFVSYCNEDRAWVLDHLLPHVERDCNISVCLHERDFQVGLSILENIVSCMDRSRLIMLIISKKFLLSQWCQFEMHLAQHRLLETRREDLILILLEEIPRRLRPNTLHYLMLTKTYIVWPDKKTEQTLFWKRLKKSLITQKLKQESVSLA